MNKKFNTIRYKHDFPFNKIEAVRFANVLKMIGSNKKVLDLGCGDGMFSKIISDMGNDVTGIEIAEGAIKKCKKRGIKVYDLDLNSDWQKKLKEKFDVVYAGEIIEHIFDTDKFLTNILLALKPSGHLVIDTPNLASFGRRIFLAFGISPLIETTARSYDAGHIRYFTYDSLKNLLVENNFLPIRFVTDTINFDPQGKVVDKFFVRIFPKLGKSLIFKCTKLNKKD